LLLLLLLLLLLFNCLYFFQNKQNRKKFDLPESGSIISTQPIGKTKKTNKHKQKQT